MLGHELFKEEKETVTSSATKDIQAKQNFLSSQVPLPSSLLSSFVFILVQAAHLPHLPTRKCFFQYSLPHSADETIQTFGNCIMETSKTQRLVARARSQGRNWGMDSPCCAFALIYIPINHTQFKHPDEASVRENNSDLFCFSGGITFFFLLSLHILGRPSSEQKGGKYGLCAQKHNKKYEAGAGNQSRGTVLRGTRWPVAERELGFVRGQLPAHLLSTWQLSAKGFQEKPSLLLLVAWQGTDRLVLTSLKRGSGI